VKPENVSTHNEGGFNLYGLEAITAHNGWSMAIVGASIDFTGLVILAIIISQLHKFLAFWENKGKTTPQENAPGKSATVKEGGKLSIPDIFPQDVHEVAGIYNSLIEQLGDTFQLSELYRLAQENNYPHPHLTITSFRQAGILTPIEDGIFTWNQ
jgi:hypothetical protein